MGNSVAIGTYNTMYPKYEETLIVDKGDTKKLQGIKGLTVRGDGHITKVD